MDARILCTQARFGLVFGRLGIVPEAASTFFLPQIVGVPRALDLVMSADILDAADAAAAGLAHEVVPPEELLSAARALVDRWTMGRSQVATALTRQMIRRHSAAADPADAHRVESLAMFYASTGDGAEGVRAFSEKRPPAFKGLASTMPPFYAEWLAP